MNKELIVIFGFLIIFVSTTLGASLVYLFKKEISPKINTLFLGFASGIMIAASVWSLLIPAINQSENLGDFQLLPAVIGFAIGGLFLVCLDKIVPHIHKSNNQEEGLKNNLKKPTKLFLAVTLHNVPEGLAVGFSFGAAYMIGTEVAMIAALGLAIGISIQNFPEGAALSLPMKDATGSKNKAFLYGMFSGIVEPLAAIVGFFLSAYITPLQPWLLAFAAGAMVFVVVEDLIPDAKLEEHPHLGTWGFMFGFIIMMVLDIVLG